MCVYIYIFIYIIYIYIYIKYREADRDTDKDYTKVFSKALISFLLATLANLMKKEALQ